MFKYVWLLSVIVITGCAATQDKFCSLIEPDSYVLVSIARCETLQVSFDYDAEAGFSALDSYAWMPVQAATPGDSGILGDSQLHAWVTDAVDAKLAQQGFRLDRKAPDFLVSYEAPVDMQGKLSLAVVLAGSQRFIWRGTANDKAYPARNLDAREERIRTAVGRLLEQFPPSRSK
jgi:hypothetical protein